METKEVHKDCRKDSQVSVSVYTYIYMSVLPSSALADITRTVQYDVIEPSTWEEMLNIQ